MIPELGHFSLILALTLALVLATVPMWGAIRNDSLLMSLARPVAQGHFVLIALAFGCLAWSFLSSDFSVQNVAANSNSHLPAQYRFAATWGSHEGSLLLWVLMLSGWMMAVTLFSRNLPLAILSRVLSVMGMISVGFLLFLLLTSNPFDRLIPAAPEGSDLNPLLQDPGMVIHPPMLYMGYVGFSVAFAFAIAALLSGRLDATWARWSRPWTTAAWCFLTIGIALGSAWAYYELGWGGWWFWDPVENASFMPWLVGTALIHSLAVTEKRGSFKSWTVLLALIAFSMSLVGTFLVRSGVLTSVHAFATDPTRGAFILVFLALVIGSSLVLYAWRAPSVGLGAAFTALSRESMLLANNVILVVAMAAVALGTLYPLVLDGLGMGKISVGPPYFAAVFYPVMLPGLILLGLGPITRWGSSPVSDLWKRRRIVAIVAVLGGVLLPFASGAPSFGLGLAIALALWIAGASVEQVVLRWRLAPQSGLIAKISASSRSFYGMHLAHVGVAVFIIGVAMVKCTEIERDVQMNVGGTTQVGGYDFRFVGTRPLEGPNYSSLQGRFEVSRDGQPVVALLPEKRTYAASGQVMTDASIAAGVFRQLYVSMGEQVDANTWGVRIYIKPFVAWIWGGCFIMALGGFLALLDKRYRSAKRRKVEEAEPVKAPSGLPTANPVPAAAATGATA